MAVLFRTDGRVAVPFFDLVAILRRRLRAEASTRLTEDISTTRYWNEA